MIHFSEGNFSNSFEYNWCSEEEVSNRGSKESSNPVLH